MQREPNRAILPLLLQTFTQQSRQKQQMIIVDPDQVTVLCLVGDSVGKDGVYALVGVPAAFVEDYI